MDSRISRWFHKAAGEESDASSSVGFRPARREELAQIWAWLEESWALSTFDDLVGWHERDPEGITVAAAGPADCFAIFGKWREMRGLAAIYAYVSAEGHGRQMLSYVIRLLRARGFHEVVSPLVDQAGRVPFDSYGFGRFQDIEVLERSVWELPQPAGQAYLADFEEADWPAVRRLDEASFEPFWRLDRDEFDHHRRQGVCRLARLEERAVGYGIVSSVRGSATLSRLAVAPDARGRGIGSQLVVEALEWARDKGAANAFVSTQGYNTDAKRLYRGLGFQPTGRTLYILKYALVDGADGRP